MLKHHRGIAARIYISEGCEWNNLWRNGVLKLNVIEPVVMVIFSIDTYIFRQKRVESKKLCLLYIAPIIEEFASVASVAAKLVIVANRGRQLAIAC